ncbi:interleukin-8-like isoform X2 [Danio aesculapii]|uniref:interleukin-8-like isoform X2 n=1 Tax=Danio aesculapii TaxID=1142201 RepID=UPI0024BF5EE7|nr:interleukin-8-like isoform X2 [Danio aesculapii]
MKLSVSAFMLLICTTALLCTNEGQPRPPPQHCQCIKTHSRPQIPERQLLALKVIPAGPHCRNEQIIATLKNEQICLSPTENWVMSLKNRFEKVVKLEEKAETQECAPKSTNAQTDELLLSCNRSCLLQNWHIHRRMDYHKCCHDAST